MKQPLFFQGPQARTELKLKQCFPSFPDTSCSLLKIMLLWQQLSRYDGRQDVPNSYWLFHCNHLVRSQVMQWRECILPLPPNPPCVTWISKCTGSKQMDLLQILLQGRLAALLASCGGCFSQHDSFSMGRQVTRISRRRSASLVIPLPDDQKPQMTLE